MGHTLQSLAQRIAIKLQAVANCRASGNPEWQHRHSAALALMVRNGLPSGSGFDAGTKLDDVSTPNRLVFTTEFHHMNDAGFYSGWSRHCVIVTPSLVHGFEVRVTGINRNGIKDYIADTFHVCLSSLADVEV